MQLHFQLNISWGFKSQLQMNPMPVHLESLWGGTLMLICRGKGYRTFWTCIFTSHLLPTKWPDRVEFCSVSSEIRGQIKKEESICGKT